MEKISNCMTACFCLMVRNLAIINLGVNVRLSVVIYKSFVQILRLTVWAYFCRSYAGMIVVTCTTMIISPSAKLRI